MIWGAGAIGGSVGAWLARAGHDVTLVDTSAAHVAAANGPGIEICHDREGFAARVPACLPQDLDGCWEIVLLAVKAQHTARALAALAPHLAEDGWVVSLQNGVMAPALDAALGPGRALVSLVGFSADLLGPGVIRFGHRAPLILGEPDGSLSHRLARTLRLMRDFEPEARASARIADAIWGKMAFVGILYVSALGTSPTVELLEDSRLQPVWRAAVGEMIQVGKSLGAAPDGFDGIDVAAFLPGAPQVATAASLARIVEHIRHSPKTHSGMWRDIAVHQRPTEADYQLAPAIAAAAAGGFEVPVLRLTAELIGRLEARILDQSDALLFQLLPAAARSPVNAGSSADLTDPQACQPKEFH